MRELSIKFAPVFTYERFVDPAWAANRTLYSRLEFIPGKTSIPLLTNHDDDREIGRVHQLFKMDWVDGPWVIASATLPAEPPPWLKKGARASFQFKALVRNEINIRGEKADHVRHAFVTEVSVLTPGVRPCEPRAEVLSVRRSKVSPAAGDVIVPMPQRVRRAPRRFYFTDDEIRQRLARAEETGIPGAIEKEIRHMKALEAAVR